MDNKTTIKIDDIINQSILSEEEKALLLDLRDILSGEKQEYYTEDMFRVFFEQTDILSLPPEEAQELLEPFDETLNMKKPLLNNE